MLLVELKINIHLPDESLRGLDEEQQATLASETAAAIKAAGIPAEDVRRLDAAGCQPHIRYYPARRNDPTR